MTTSCTLCLFDALAFSDALADRDVHSAWRIWSEVAEGALASACELAGGPSSSQGIGFGERVCSVS